MKPASADERAPEPGKGTVNDARLTPWLTVQTGTEADRALKELLEDIAMPTLTRAVRAKIGTVDHRRDAEDIVAEARLQIIRRLQQLRETPEAAAARPLVDFQAYVAAVAYTAWAWTVRRRHPARAALVDRLRYLLEGRTNQQGFALWTGAGGEWWAGFAGWREREKFLAGTGPKTGHLLADSGAAAAAIFGRDSHWEALPLPEVVGSLFAWLGEPLRLRDLTDVVARWQGIHADGVEILAADAAEEEALAEVPAAGPSPHDELRWKEYLLWLLGAVGRLTLRQRCAFLLHSSCLHEMERLGLTGIRHTASLLGLPPERLAGYWAKLPLEDRIIGTLLGLGPQQVINLRKVARGILGRAWQSILQGN